MDTIFSHQEVERLAFELWERRGSPYGSPDVDWLEAEDILRARRAADGHTSERVETPAGTGDTSGVQLPEWQNEVKARPTTLEASEPTESQPEASGSEPPRPASKQVLSQPLEREAKPRVRKAGG